MEDTRQRAQDLLHSLRVNHLWERFRTSDPMVAFSDVRDEFERKVEDSVGRLMASLQLVTRGDLERIEGEIASLGKKVDNLARQVRKSHEEN